MATKNPFDLLGDNDNDDPSQLLESASVYLQKSSEITPEKKVPKMPSKPVPPTQAVREARSETGHGGRGSGRGGGRGRGGYNRESRDYQSIENAFNNVRAPAPQGDGEGRRDYEKRPYGGPRPPYRGGRRGGFGNDEGTDGDRPRRTYERHSGTGRGSEFKREGSGRGNWGSQSDEVAPGAEEVPEETEKNVDAETVPAAEEAVDVNKEAPAAETEEKEAEEKEMTLEEYEKVREEKRKALLALKTEERKVEVDKDLQSMQQLSSRRNEESVFIKLASDKDKKKESTEKEKTKKSVSINEFLKPSGGEYRGRGRGGRGARGGGGGGSYGGGNRMTSITPAPEIQDKLAFPTLGGAPRA